MRLKKYIATRWHLFDISNSQLIKSSEKFAITEAIFEIMFHLLKICDFLFFWKNISRRQIYKNTRLRRHVHDFLCSTAIDSWWSRGFWQKSKKKLIYWAHKALIFAKKPTTQRKNNLWRLCTISFSEKKWLTKFCCGCTITSCRVWTSLI